MEKFLCKIEKFYKIATLSSDMAARMLVSKQGLYDYDIHSLRLAANGAKDLCYYTKIAIRDELNHYLGKLPPIKFLDDKPNLNNIDQYISFFKMASQMFSEEGKWGLSFGGKKWQTISEGILKVTEWYKKALESKDSLEEAEVIKRLLIYINAFDGLAHNTGSVYDKLVAAETEELNLPYQTSFNKIQKLRDISESPYDIDVLKEIIPNLETTLPFKKQLQKEKQNPEFYTDTSQRIKDEIQKVKKIKEIKQIIYDKHYNLNDHYERALSFKSNEDKINNLIRFIQYFLLSNQLIREKYGNYISVNSIINKLNQLNNKIKSMSDNDKIAILSIELPIIIQDFWKLSESIIL